MQLIKEYQCLVNKGLIDIKYPQYPEKLYDPIRYFTALGGKRIRPALTLIAAEMYELSLTKALPAALAIEVFHNFTLLHDDIMDKAPLRRGKETVHEKWNSSVAILSGDAMLITAYQLLAQCPAEVLPDALNVFNAVAIEVCQGQQLDMDYEAQDQVAIDEYINMIRLKTAVLLGAALKLGALISGAPASDADFLEEFGVNVGIAFQLQDDLLDVYGETQTFGKEIGGDILANKKTFLMLNALGLAKGEDADLLEHWVSRTDESQQKIQEITKLYDRLNIPELTRNEMQKYSEKAYRALNQVALPLVKKESLKQLAESLLLRNT